MYIFSIANINLQSEIIITIIKSFFDLLKSNVQF